MANRKCWELFLLAILPTLSYAGEKAPAFSKTFLLADAPIALPGKIGRFDYMEIDVNGERLLAAHAGAGSLALVDLKSGKVLPAIEVGSVHGVAIGASLDSYILGDAQEKKVVFVNAKKLAKTGELAVSGPVDAIAFDSKNGMAFADEDDGNHVWVIDVEQKKLVSTIEISGVPEFVVYDPTSDRVYQNIKTKDLVAVINPKSNKVQAEWSTLPASGPHGLAVDGNAGYLFVAGHNGKLVEIDLKSGKVRAQVEIAPGTDQIAFDPGSRVIYAASKGYISAVQESDTGLVPLGNTPAPSGAHTLAVDPSRHEVWISYADKTHSYLQRFKVSEK